MSIPETLPLIPNFVVDTAVAWVTGGVAVWLQGLDTLPRPACEDRWDEKASLRAGVPLGRQFKSGLEAQAGG